MKNSRMNNYDNEYYEKKYNKYKQKYLFATKKQHGGNKQIGGNIEFKDIMTFDSEFRMNPSINNIKDLSSNKIILREKESSGRFYVAKKIIDSESGIEYTYSPWYALIDDNYKINSCIPYSVRPVSKFLSLLCEISNSCGCPEPKDICRKNYGLYKDQSSEVGYNPKYYEPMVPVIKVINHIKDIDYVKDSKYQDFMCDVSTFIEDNLKPQKIDDKENNIIGEYLETTKIYTSVHNLLKLIIELRNVSSFSHKYFSRISHLRTLPISMFLNFFEIKKEIDLDPKKKEKYPCYEYYTTMVDKLKNNIPERLEKIHKFIFGSDPRDEKYNFDGITVNTIKKNIEEETFTFNNNFFRFNKNDVCDLLEKLYKLIDKNAMVEKINIPEKAIRITCNEVTVTKKLYELNITTYNSGIRLHECIYDATKTILTYLSYKELDKTCIFIREIFPLLCRAFESISSDDQNKSLEVLATNVFIVQKGCFLCEPEKNAENKFNLVSAKNRNDIYFISLCGLDFSTMPTSRDNYMYLSGTYKEDYSKDDDMVNILTKFYKEYKRIFVNLLNMCANEGITYLSMVPFGAGVFLDGLKRTSDADLKPFLIMYILALREALSQSTIPINLYLGFGKMENELLYMFGKDSNGNFNNVNTNNNGDINKIYKNPESFLTGNITNAKEGEVIKVGNNNVILHGKDAKSIAIKLKQDSSIKGKVGFINASDFIALIFGKIGYYTLDGYSDRYAGEEDFACTSTGMLACDDVYKSLGFNIEHPDKEDMEERENQRKTQISEYIKKKEDKQKKYKNMQELKKSVKDTSPLAEPLDRVQKELDRIDLPDQEKALIEEAILQAANDGHPEKINDIAEQLSGPNGTEQAIAKANIQQSMGLEMTGLKRNI